MSARLGRVAGYSPAALTARRAYASFSVNMETSAPPHGTPRGIVNRAIAQGLPPYAAWLTHISNKQRYEMANVDDQGFRPKNPAYTEQIWGNEKVRMRVRASANFYMVNYRLNYPWMRTGVWYSDALDNWVQVPHVQGVVYDIEREGGFDEYIMRRPGYELQSLYAERLRRNIIARRKETRKNFILKKHAQAMADAMEKEFDAATTPEELFAVCDKYGVRRSVVAQIAERESGADRRFVMALEHAAPRDLARPDLRSKPGFTHRENELALRLTDYNMNGSAG